MEWKPVDAMWRDPPFIKREVIGCRFVIGLRIVLLNGLKMNLQECDDFIVGHKAS
jgi:hypothetical protein